jgi:hypothetical protein
MAKRILIQFGGYFLGLPAGIDSGAIVGALANAQVYNQDYCSSGPTRYKPIDGGNELMVSFVDDSVFEPRRETETLLARDVEQSNKRWLDEYTKHEATKKKLKEAEERLKGIDAVVTQKAA